MNTQLNIAVNKATVYQALEVMDGYDEVLDGLVNMIRAIRTNDESAVLEYASGIASTIQEEINDPGFVETWPHYASLLVTE